MTFEEMVMNLILAINDENLEETKKYTNLINSLEFYSTGDLTNMLNINHRFQNYKNYLDNECIEYVLLHLKINKSEEIRLFRKKLKLIRDSDPFVIRDFINSELNHKSYGVPEQMFVQVLIELTVQLSSPEEIKTFFDRINARIKATKEE